MQVGQARHEGQLVQLSELALEADLCLPQHARALVIFAHGSGSSRHSTRNQYLAEILNNAGIGTLLVDLLTSEEKEADSETRHLRFDIPLLASRMESVTKWSLQEFKIRNLSLGYFASSTGAAAALIASTKFKNSIKALALRGGRPDLAEKLLHEVIAPTLLIVGALDAPVIGVNKRVLKNLKSAMAKDIVVIPGAGHLFEESGKMEQVADCTLDWFRRHLLEESDHKIRKPVGSNIIMNVLTRFKSGASLHLQFRDRVAAGRMLAGKLHVHGGELPIITGIANGGVVVADTIRRSLGADLEIVFPKRLRSPTNSENAIGAIMHDGSIYLDRNSLAATHVSDEYLEIEKQIQQREIDRRLALHGSGSKQNILNGRTVILVDDGAATGSTIIVAARWIRQQFPSKLIIALPVASTSASQQIRKEADRTEIIMCPAGFKTVEQYYKNFEQVTDQVVAQIMQELEFSRATE